MEFELPWFNGDYVLLTPRNLLTKDDTWINRSDLIAEFQTVVAAVPNDQLRAQINNYFIDRLGKKSTQKERSEAALATVRKFPAFIEYYIRYKEDHGDQARTASESRVKYSELVFVERGQSLSTALKTTGFYGQNGYTYAEAHDRIAFLKKVIEDQDGWRLFYIDGKPVRREKDLQVLFRLTWRGTPSDVNREVNNGRGPVDFSISRGSGDKTLVEFKLASNSQLAQNLKHQLEVYQRAGQAQHVIKVVLYFTEGEFARVRELLKSLGLSKHKDIMLIDGREKISASKATDATEKR